MEHEVQLRPVGSEDLPMLFEFQSDAESNRMALMHPRSRTQFDEHWCRIFADSEVWVRVVTCEDQLVGCISTFPLDGQHHVGYRIGRAFWVRGIATRSLRLLLEKVEHRPIYARVAEENISSIHVLKNCSFVVLNREMSPASERFLECQEVVMKLSARS